MLFLLFFRQGGIYTKRFGYWKLLECIFRGCTYATGAIIVFVYMSHIAGSTSRLFVGLLWIFSIVLVTLSRYLFAHILNWASVGSVPVLLVGAGKTANLVLQGIRDDVGLNFNVIGYVDDAGPQEENVGNLPYLGTFGQVVEVIDKTQVQDVCIAAPGLTPDKLNSLIHTIQPHVRNLSFVPDLIGLPVNGIEVDSLFNERLMFMSLKNNLARPYNRFIKRIFDLVLTTLGVVVLSPVFLLLAVLIKLDSRGPVIFAHQRIGKNGKLFPCLKFRTMCVDADKKLKEYLAANPEARKEWEAEFKLKDDPRVTRVGKVLRKTSLDELPQLFNVLIGQMSLVGPRPIVTAEIPKYGPYIKDFYMVHPGITGMWQVNGRSDTTYEERVQMDSWYVRNWDVWLDIMLLWRTFGVVLQHKGAY
jgi:Undecaprenyl-phosphate galactose phosphotransferase WbaP